jgi:hypothetical protein
MCLVCEFKIYILTMCVSVYEVKERAFLEDSMNFQGT